MPPRATKRYETRQERTERLKLRHAKLTEKAITLSTWLVCGSMPFLFALETSLAQQFQYKLVGDAYQRMFWSIIIFVIFSFVAALATLGTYYVRMKWDHPHLRRHRTEWDYIMEYGDYMVEEIDSIAFLASVLPFLWFLPFVLFQVMATMINDYYHPDLDYNRVVSSWSFTAILGFATFIVIIIIFVLDHVFRNPRKHRERHRIQEELSLIGESVHTPPV